MNADDGCRDQGQQPAATWGCSPGTPLDRRNPVTEALLIQFDALLATALGEWPESLALPVRPAANGGILVEGLTELENGISRPWIGHPREVLMSNLHWAICTAVHARFKESREVVPRRLDPEDIRRKFEADLRGILRKNSSWLPQDLGLIAQYFADSDR
jgi:hypothetical protein